MKKKTLLMSSLTILSCVCVATGATFALFTDESKTSISITSGKVDVNASLTLEEIHTPKTIGLDGITQDATETAVKVDEFNGTFGLGGTVAINDKGDVQFDKMAPGDKAVLKVSMTNESNVSLMQRMTVKCTDADKAFYDQLLIGISDDNAAYTYYSDFASAWESNATVYGAGTEAVKYISIELPAFVGNNYTEKTANLAVNVVAVQGNAATVNDDSMLVHIVDNQATLDTAVNDCKENETIFVSATAATPLTINYEGAKAFNVRGYHLDDLTINAANASINLYNDVATLTATAVASESLHVYGNVENLVLNQGRVVVENNAAVEEIKLAPAAGNTALFIVSELAENATEADKIGEIKTISVEKADESANAVIRVPAEIQEEVKDKLVGDAIVGVSTAIKTAQQLADAVATSYNGEVIKLGADITINETLTFDGGYEYSLDLCGYTLTINSEENNVHDGFVVSGGSTLNLTNSVEEEGTYIFNCAKGNEDAIYVKNDVEGKTSTVNVMNPVKVVMDIKGGSAFHAEAPKGNAVVNIEEGTNILVSGAANNSVGAIYIGLNSTLNMTGGELTINATFDDDYDSWNRDACGIVLFHNNAHAYLTGGKFSINGKNSFAQGIQIATMNGKAENTNFLIQNAEFIINNEGEGECYPFAIFDPSQGSGRIENATVSGNFDGFATQYYDGPLNIEVVGGTFTVDPSDYVAEGYECNEVDGKYVVAPKATTAE